MRRGRFGALLLVLLIVAVAPVPAAAARAGRSPSFHDAVSGPDLSNWFSGGADTTGTVAVRDLADLAIVSMTTRQDSSGADYLSVGVANHGPTVSAKTKLTILADGATGGLPNGCAVQYGGYLCQLGDVGVTQGNEAYALVEVPLAEGWQHRSVTAVVTGLYPDPVGTNNISSIVPPGATELDLVSTGQGAPITPYVSASAAPEPAIPIGLWVTLAAVVAVVGAGTWLVWRRLRPARSG